VYNVSVLTQARSCFFEVRNGGRNGALHCANMHGLTEEKIFCFGCIASTEAEIRYLFSILYSDYVKPVLHNYSLPKISLSNYALFEVERKKEVNQSDQSHSMHNSFYLLFTCHIIKKISSRTQLQIL